MIGSFSRKYVSAGNLLIPYCFATRLSLIFTKSTPNESVSSSIFSSSASTVSQVTQLLASLKWVVKWWVCDVVESHVRESEEISLRIHTIAINRRLPDLPFCSISHIYFRFVYIKPPVRNLRNIHFPLNLEIFFVPFFRRLVICQIFIEIVIIAYGRARERGRAWGRRGNAMRISQVVPREILNTLTAAFCRHLWNWFTTGIKRKNLAGRARREREEKGQIAHHQSDLCEKKIFPSCEQAKILHFTRFFFFFPNAMQAWESERRA